MHKYFAQLDDNNIVIRVIVVESAELAVQLFGGTWVETVISPNKNFAGKGYTYVPGADNFIRPQPTSNHVLDSITFNWKLPTDSLYTYVFCGSPIKTIITVDNKIYKWNERTQNWDEL